MYSIMHWRTPLLVKTPYVCMVETSYLSWPSPFTFLSAPPEIFTEAQQYVFTQMETTLLSRFLQSHDGQNYLKALVTRDIDRRQKNRSASVYLIPQPWTMGFLLQDLSHSFLVFSKAMRQNPEQKPGFWATNSQAFPSSNYCNMWKFPRIQHVIMLLVAVDAEKTNRRVGGGGVGGGGWNSAAEIIL